MAGSAHHEIGDPALPASSDQVFQRFAEDVFMPAVRLCRLARSLQDLALLGGAPGEELGQMRVDPDGFFHGEYLLHIGTKLAFLQQTEVIVVPRGGKASHKTPDIALPCHQVAIELLAHEHVAAFASTTHDFEHADAKFSCYFTHAHGEWIGVVGIELGFRGSPTLPDLGLLGPRHDVISADIRANFEMYASLARDSGGRHYGHVNALLLTWTSAECEERCCPDGVSAVLFPTDVSGLEYAPGFPRRSRALDDTFHAFPRTPDRTAYRSPERGSAP